MERGVNFNFYNKPNPNSFANKNKDKEFKYVKFIYALLKFIFIGPESSQNAQN